MPKISSGAGSSEEITQIWTEIKTLHQSLDSIRQELAFVKDAINDSSQTLFNNQNEESISMPNAEDHSHAYAQEVSTIDIVLKVILTQYEGNSIIWTIIEDPPPADSPQKPTYDDQLDTLEILKYNMPLNLDILNTAKARRRKQLHGPDAKIIWERQ
jgi:hypothetical protein